jgi:predicted nuclease of predicted toxin-antitoxin system
VNLFDQNLSHRLARSLADIFPDSDHVRNVGLGRGDDDAVWQYAAAQNFVIVSKDSDFHQLSFVRGHPPKVVWIRRGNSSTDEIGSLLRQHEADLRAFERDPDASFLVLS